MDFARILRGFCVGFARNLILFLFEREREGYKRFADCTVYNKNPKIPCSCWWRASSVNCLVPSYKLYLFKLSNNNKAQHWRSDGHKCYNNARTNMPKGNPVVTKIYFYLETEQGIYKEFRKQVFFKMNSSLGSFLLHYNGDKRVSVP